MERRASRPSARTSLLLLLVLKLFPSGAVRRSRAKNSSRSDFLGRGSFRRRHHYRDAQFAFRIPFVNSARRRNVRIIPSNRNANVAFSAN